MTKICAVTEQLIAESGTPLRGRISASCAKCGGQTAEDVRYTLRSVDFSDVNFQYLFCAHELARTSSARAAVLLGAPDALIALLAELDADALAAVREIKAPLLILRQAPWWWQRLFAALRDDRPDELRAVLEHAGLMAAKG